ncbi:MAG TPA: PTS sugar transporter subunit IIC [bacterium]|nr:PTS sugar transporter subunit IIC [bacterium]
MTEWLLLPALLGLVSLDVSAVGQFMVSRPIVTGPLVGFLLGQPALGLEMGALIEIIWIGDLPVGAHLPIDIMMLAGVSTAFACELAGQGHFPPEAVMTYAIGICIPLAALSTEAEMLLRRFHVRWVHFAQKLASEGHDRLFGWLNWIVLGELFVKGFLTALVSLFVAHLTGRLFLILPPKVLQGLYYAYWLLLALGCSAVIDLMVERQTVAYLILSIAAFMTLAIFLHLPGVLLVGIALLSGFVLSLFYMRRGEAR